MYYFCAAAHKDCFNKKMLTFSLQSPMFDGKVPHWYHYMCFFAKQRPKCVGDIAHFESLRWDDQEKIKTKIGKRILFFSFLNSGPKFTLGLFALTL